MERGKSPGSSRGGALETTATVICMPSGTKSLEAFSIKAKESNIIVVEDFNYNEIQTKNHVKTLNNLNVAMDKSIFVLPSNIHNVVLSSRNIPNSKTVNASDLHVYDILNCDKLIISESSISLLTERLK